MKRDAGTIIFSARADAPFQIGFHDNAGAEGSEKTYEVLIGKSAITIKNNTGRIIAQTSEKDAVVEDSGNSLTTG